MKLNKCLNPARLQRAWVKFKMLPKMFALKMRLDFRGSSFRRIRNGTKYLKIDGRDFCYSSYGVVLWLKKTKSNVGQTFRFAKLK